jgi:hypothetical protein
MRRYPAPHSGHIISDFHIGGTCALTQAYASQKTCHSQTDAPTGPRRLRRKPEGRHLLIRDDPTGAFEPGNARWRIAARYRWRRRADQRVARSTTALPEGKV